MPLIRFFLKSGVSMFPLLMLMIPAPAPAAEETEAAQDGLVYQTFDDEARIDNGEISVRWNSKQKIVAFQRNNTEFARASLPEGGGSLIVKHSVSGRDGATIAAITLVVQSETATETPEEEGDIEAIYTLTERSPFVVATSMFKKKNFENGPAKKFVFPEMNLKMPGESGRWQFFGTDQLRSKEARPGSFLYLAVVDPATRNGLVAGWITNRRGLGVFYPEKKENGAISILPEVNYGTLPEPIDEDPRRNLSEVFVLGWFDDCRRGLERYAWQVVRANQIRLRTPSPGAVVYWSGIYRNRKPRTPEEIERAADFAKEKLLPYGFGLIRLEDRVFLDDLAGLYVPEPSKQILEGKAPKENADRQRIEKTAEIIRARGLGVGVDVVVRSGGEEAPGMPDDWFVKVVHDTGTFKSKGSKETWKTDYNNRILDPTKPEPRRFMTEEFSKLTGEKGFREIRLESFLNLALLGAATDREEKLENPTRSSSTIRT